MEHEQFLIKSNKQLFKEIEEAAVMWNKTKDQYYKTLWYDLLKKLNFEKD